MRMSAFTAVNELKEASYSLFFMLGISVCCVVLFDLIFYYWIVYLEGIIDFYIVVFNLIELLIEFV